MFTCSSHIGRRLSRLDILRKTILFRKKLKGGIVCSDVNQTIPPFGFVVNNPYSACLTAFSNQAS